MLRKRLTIIGPTFAFAIIGVAALGSSVRACKNFLLIAADGMPVYARSLEYSLVVPSGVVDVPRNFAYVGTRPNSAQGAKWTSHYAKVGVMSFGQPHVRDGMNEMGLARGALHFPGFAEYTAPANADPATALAPWEFLR